MVTIEDSRKKVLESEFDKPYFQSLIDFLKKEKTDWETIYPPGSLIFNAFSLTPFDQVKVVVLWQDPYHGPGQAMGLSFSVPPWVVQPPSLKNIFKEMASDLWLSMPKSWDLSYRAKQWVFLLNAILTVRARQAASHREKWWEKFTDAVIKLLSDRKEGLVFLLWGSYAQSKRSLVDESKHTVLTAPHPSPLSAHRWWFGCEHFSKTNKVLEQYWKKAIDWQL